MSDNIDPGRARAALAAVIPEAFADMAFIDAEPVAEPSRVPETRAAIDILKPFSCRLEIAAGPGVRERIADILFGESEERGRDDAFLELLNIAAGSFITRYFGAGSDIRLELPHYLYFEEEGEGSPVVSLAFDAEGEPVVATLRSVRYRY